MLTILLFATTVAAQEAAITLAGSLSVIGSTDGPAASALFHDPAGLAIDASNNLYVADSQNHTIRKLSPEAVVTTFAGQPGRKGSINGSRSAASFNNPSAITIAQNGTVYVTDTGNNTIRTISSNGLVGTLAGAAGQSGMANGIGANARFNSPLGLAVDHGGTLYVADSGNHTIRKITPGGTVTTFAGSPAVWGSADGTGSTARFNCPVGIALDGEGNVFVSDANNYTIRKITPGGVVSTLAGLPGVEGSADGVGIQARFGKPAELKIGANGNIYLVDAFNCTIRKITTNSEVTTIAGLPGSAGASDGLGSYARFFNPYGLVIDHNSNLRISDAYNETVRFLYNPIVVSLERRATPSRIVINWQGVVGNKYQLQYRPALDSGPWQNLGAFLIATNTHCEEADVSNSADWQRFYRVILIP